MLSKWAKTLVFLLVIPLLVQYSVLFRYTRFSGLESILGQLPDETFFSDGKRRAQEISTPSDATDEDTELGNTNQSGLRSTGAMVNCSMPSKGIRDYFFGSGLTSPADDSDPGFGETTVSCKTMRYGAPAKSFKEAGEIIVGVLSSSKNVEQRAAIRNLWAKGHGVFFIVAGKWSDVAEEFEKYADIVWIDDEEDYFNIVRKTAAFIDIVDQLTTRLNLQYSYVLKTDDDSYVAMDRLGDLLRSLEERGAKPDYWGRCHGKEIAPDRRKSSKYYVSKEEYPEPFFPRYCQGAGFAMSREFVHCAANGNHIRQTRYLKFEDAFVGLLAERCSIKAIHDTEDWSLRVYRTGYLEKEFNKERKRILTGAGRVRFPKPEMAGRVIQHRIVDKWDMREHHLSETNPRTIRKKSAMAVGEVVEFFNHQRWVRGTVVETLPKSVKMRIKGNKILKIPFIPYYKQWRKQASNTIPRTSLAKGPKVSPVPSLTDLFLDRFIVVPEYKLLFCYMEKNACSMFNHLFRMLRLLHPSLQSQPEEVAFQANDTWFRNTPHHHGLDRLALENILADPAWTKAVFYRNPLSRFLSAFRSKCEGGDYDGARTCQRVFGKGRLSFSDVISSIDEGELDIFSDQHFIPMSNFCGGIGNTLEYYDLVSEILPGGSQKEIKTLLKQLDVPRNVSRILLENVVKTGGTALSADQKLITKFHGVRLSGDHSQKKSHNTKSGGNKTMLSYYQNQQAVSAIENIYDKDYLTFNMSRSNQFADVVRLDETAVKNVEAHYQGAASWISLHNSTSATTEPSLTTRALMATVDRRPVTIRRQIELDKHGRHRDGERLGCSIVSNTFVSDLREIKLRQSDLQLIETTNMESTCSVCFQFASQSDALDFIPKYTQGVTPSSSTKCFEGETRVTGRFANWQKADERFTGHGYPWTVDCVLPNGIKELTCRKISRMQDQIAENDRLQKIFFRTKIVFESAKGNLFDVHSQWPWAALQSHNDNRKDLSYDLPRHMSDTSSAFVPLTADSLKLGLIQGPLFHVDSQTEKDKVHSDAADDEEHFRLLSTLFHVLRNSPGTTIILGVSDGEVHNFYNQLLQLVKKDVQKLYTKRFWTVLAKAPATGLISSVETEHSEPLFADESQTLAELLRLRGVSLTVVPWVLPFPTAEKSVCGGQYGFASYIAARFAADYHVVMYTDSDAYLVEQSETLNEILHDQFFGDTRRTVCAGHRFPIIENYLDPRKESVGRVLKCVDNILSDKARFDKMTKHCQNLRPGHVVARSDSVSAFDVHHVRVGEFMPSGVRDCSSNEKEIVLDTNEVFQVHVRNRFRKDACKCSVVDEIDLDDMKWEESY